MGGDVWVGGVPATHCSSGPEVSPLAESALPDPHSGFPGDHFITEAWAAFSLETFKGK